MGRSCTTRGGLRFFMKLKGMQNNLNIYNRSKNGTNLWDDLILYSITLFKFKNIIVRLTIRTVLYSLLIVNSLPVTKDQMKK